jgi:hypothetical protein
LLVPMLAVAGALTTGAFMLERAGDMPQPGLVRCPLISTAEFATTAIVCGVADGCGKRSPADVAGEGRPILVNYALADEASLEQFAAVMEAIRRDGEAV